MSNEPTNIEILEAINTFSDSVDQRFDSIETEMTSMKSEMTSMKSEMTSMKSQMVTKDYLDRKLDDLRGDMVALVRQEDDKVGELIGSLAKCDSLPESEAERLLKMQPFLQA